MEGEVKLLHPFGREEEVALNQLFRFFSNNIHLGQWELARACISELHIKEAHLGFRVTEILRSIATNPVVPCLGSPSIANPHKLSWLCVQELKALASQDGIDKDLLDVLSKDAEFRLLLCEASKEADNLILKELYIFHQKCHCQDVRGSHGISESVGTLSPDCLHFLQKLMLKRPLLADAFIRSSSFHQENQGSTHNESLQKIYLTCLDDITSDLLNMQASGSNIAHDRQATFYDILSHFNMWPNMEQLLTPVKGLFHNICDILMNDPQETLLSRHKIYSSLLGRDSTFLIRLFCTVEHSHRVHCMRGNIHLSQELGTIQAAARYTNRTDAWKDVMLVMWSEKRHFLDMIMDTSMELIKKRCFKELTELFGPPELQPLKSLAVLIGWDRCGTLQDAQELVSAMTPVGDLDPGDLLGKATQKIQYQVELVNWCVEKIRSSSLGEVSKPASHLRPLAMLQDLQTHTVLYMLQACTRLSALPEDDVMQILMKKPGDKLDQQKHVHFSTSGDVDIEGLDQTTMQEVSVYKSFCAIRHFMEAVHFGLEQEVPRLPSAKSQDKTDLCGPASAVKNRNNKLSLEKYEELYKNEVLANFQKGKDALAGIFPVSARVSVLEYLFGLLFVTTEDVHRKPVCEESSDEEGASEVLTGAFSGDLTESIEILSTGSPSSKSAPESPLASTEISSTNLTPSFHHASESLMARTEINNTNLKPSLLHDQELMTQQSSKGHTSKKLQYGSEQELLHKVVESSGKETQKTCSGSHSAHSITSTHGCIKTGLVVNELIARDLMISLQESLTDLKLNDEKYSITGGYMSVDSDRNTTSTELQRQISHLDQDISEAMWRFQLVAQGHVPLDYGKVTMLPPLSSIDYVDTDFTELSSEDEEESVRSKSQSVKGSSVHRVVEESEGHTPGDSTGTGSNGSRKLHGRKRGRQRRTTETIHYPANIVSLMFADSHTLLSMCLKEGNFSQAQQVVQLLNIQDTIKAAEVHFAEQFVAAAQRLQAYRMNHGGSSATPRMRPGTGISKLGMIASVAAAGMSSLSISNIIDQLLSSEDLPKISESLVAQIIHESPHLSGHIDNWMIPAMVTFDLSLCVTKSCPVSSELLKIAHSRLPSEKLKHSISKKGGHMPGFRGFLNKMIALVKLGSEKCGERGSPEPYSSHQHIIRKFYHLSVPQLISLATIPLDAQEMTTYLTALLHLSKGAAKLIKGWSDLETIFKAKESVNTKDSLRRVRPDLRLAFSQLLEMFQKQIPPEGLTGYILRHYKSSAALPMLYLDSLFEHVKSMSALMAQSEGGGSDLSGEEYFRVLLESPTRIIGKLIFINKMSPVSVEAASEKLQVDLTKVIVDSCAPNVSSKTCNRQVTDPRLQRHRIVLNYSREWTGNPRHPEVLVRELLMLLIQSMKRCREKASSQSFMTESASTLANSDEYQDIVRATQELAFVDLALLTSEEEKLCFYGNLLNLMGVHIKMEELLDQQTDQSDRKIVSEFLPVSLIKHIMWSKMEYAVGALGPVSWTELRYHILRKGLPFPENDSTAPCSPNQEALWEQFMPAGDPRVTFVISQGQSYSPALQVLHPELLESQLKRAVVEYLDHFVNITDDKVQVPHYVSVYCQDFGHESLMDFIKAFASQSTKDWSSALCPEGSVEAKGPVLSSPEVEVLEPHDDLLYIFDYTPVRKTSVGSAAHKRQISLPSNLQENKPPITQSHAETLKTHKEKAYSLTPMTLDYLKTKSQLVASLMSVVCSDEMDDIEYQMEEDYFESVSPEDELYQKASTESGQLDMRSYRYQQLCYNYPVFCRHILQNVIPVMTAKDPELLGSPDILLKAMTKSLDLSIRNTVLTTPQNEAHQVTLRDLFNEMVAERRWAAVLKLIEHIPAVMFKNCPDWSKFLDYICCCMVHDTSCGDERWKNLFRIVDPVTQANHILLSLKSWEFRVARKTLKYCIWRKDLPEEVRKILQQKLDILELYQRIAENAKQLHTKAEALRISEETSTDSLPKLCKWQAVADQSELKPEEVLDVILQSHDFETARTWAKVRHVPADLKQRIETHHILYLLDREVPDEQQASKMLKDLYGADADHCQNICDDLLPQFKVKNNMILIIQFLLEKFPSSLSTQRQTQLQLTMLGAKAMMCIPEMSRGDYMHLLEQPVVLMEMLLMNMQVDWLLKIFNVWQEVLDGETLPELTKQTCDKLLCKYAQLALEFPIVEEVTSNLLESRSLSRMSLTSLVSTTPVAKQTTSPQPFTRSQSMVRTPSRISLVGSPKEGVLPTSVSAAASLGRKGALTTRTMPGGLESAGVFVMPVDPPSRKQWVPDSAVTHCMVCLVERFSMFNRRHHCRRCGRVVCSNCSGQTTVIKGTSARTCSDCYRQTFPPKEGERRMSSTPGTSVGSARAVFTIGSPASVASEDSQQERERVSTGTDWHLEANSETNKIIREDFYYEYAPSVSLCLSILELHSDTRESANMMLSLCDDISKHLQPISPGVRNPEVDYSFVISMMQYLLFKAKVKFMQVGDQLGVTTSDTYIGRVGLLEMLTSVNCSYIPSIQQLTKMDTLRRLRDKLIEEEKFGPAMDVSTKCGIDPHGVWATWGLACLKVGDYPTAREKFNRFLKPPKEKNATIQMPRVLSDILDVLDKAPQHGKAQGLSLLAQLQSVRSLVSEPVHWFNQKPMEDRSPEFDPLYKEATYYLEKYGTHSHMVSYLMKHHQLHTSLQYILNKSCQPEVFIENVLMLSLRRGKLSVLQEEMMTIDPTLNCWGSYLSATCRHLDKIKSWNVLYQFQLFMKDFIRAAMTCINHFYQSKAASYMDLFPRITHLEHAKSHLESYMDQRQWGSVPRPSTMRSPLAKQAVLTRLIMTPGEINKNINIISLQIDVTKFLHQYYDQLEVASSSSPTPPPGGPPTLFGGTKTKAQVATQVMLAGNNVNVGFGLAFRIIQDFRLDSSFIYKQAGRLLARQHKYTAIHQLLKCIKESGLCTNEMFDEVVSACIQAVSDQPDQAKETETLIKMLKLDKSKIQAYIASGKLKSAYLIAVKGNRAEDICAIATAAEQSGQAAVKAICEKWLSQKGFQ